MLGSSRTSLRLLDERLDAAYQDAGLAQAGSDLLAITDLLTREKTLRQALADSGRPTADRERILASLVAGQVAPLALEIASMAVGLRWSSDADFVDALEIAGASALLGAAEQAGTVDRVEEELFRFSRIVDANGELQLTLSGSALSAPGKRSLVERLLVDRADPTSVQLTSFAITHLRGRRIDEALGQLVELAAKRRGRISAVVKVARPLEGDQQERLSAALERVYGRPVQLSVDIDPAVLGGVSVQVGDEIIDGTIAHRMNEARRRLAG
jgi:F-type H+-transporting ATPase subunit delta